MSSPKKIKDESLRLRAKGHLSKGKKGPLQASPEDPKKLIEELQVHQIELEMQNKELGMAQGLIEDSRSKYVDLYDFAPVGYCTLMSTGEIVEANLTGAKLLGFDREKIRGIPFSAFVAGDSRAVFRNHCLKVLAGGEKEYCELKMNRKDGSSFYASMESIAVADGQNGKIRAVVTDITERKLAEEEIRRLNAELEGRVKERTAQIQAANQELRNEIGERQRAEEEIRLGMERLRLALDASNSGAWEWDLRSNENVWSEELWKVYGLEPHSCKPSYEAWRQTILAEDRVKAKHAVQEAASKGTELNAEWRVRGLDGTERWLMSRGRPVRDKDGQVGRFIGIVTDITERKRAEEALRKSEESAQGLAHENAVMAEIGRIISSTPNLDAVYQLFAEKVKGLLPYDRIVINLIHKDSGALVNRYVEGDSAPGRNLGEVFPMAGTSTARLFQSRKGLLLDSQDENEITVNFPGLVPELKAGFRSFLSVPLISGDQPIGGLHFRSKRYRAYEEKDLKLAGTIAAQIAGAIANAQLFAERKQAEEALRKSEETARELARENEIIASIGRITSSTLTAQDLYQGFGEEARKIIPFDRIVISMIDREKSTFKAVYIAGEGVPGQEVGMIHPLQGSGVGETARTKSTFLLQTEDFDAYEDRFPILLSTFQAGFRSILNVPLFSKGEVIGGLLLRSRKAYAYEDKDVRVAERIADQIAGAVANAQLFSEGKRAEEALRESEEKYRSLVANAMDAIFIAQDDKIKFPNPKTLALSGYSEGELSQMSFIHWVHPDDRKAVLDRYRRRMAGENIDSVYTFRCLNRAGEVIWVQGNSAITLWEGRPATINFVRDITLEKRLEGQLLQAQKVEAIGTLAGGIAHDFNNILSAIIGYAELAGFDIPENSQGKYNLQQSLKACHRAKDLVQQILAFSRQGKQERKLLDIKAIIEEGLKLMRASLPATIEIRQDVEQNLGTIEANPTQIHQVLMNLCTNAAHAMSEHGGVLEVSLRKVDLDGDLSPASAGVQPGPYLRFRVSDTGHGMTPEVLKRIFDPYFTTKEVGKGTGLGLAVVHGIVKSHGGGITVSSEPGKGTTFDIYLPRIEAFEGPSATDTTEPIIPGAQERVLLVDDEQAIVEIGQEILGRLGYQVAGRTSSLEALELFRGQPDQFDLVITDMTMPNMTGDRLARELLQIRPGLPIILCTGFSERITEEKAKAMGIREFVMKPLVMKELAKAMRRALDS